MDFDELYAASYQRLVGSVFLVTGDLAEAQDAVQEAFVRALARWRRVATMDHPEGWVRRVAVNLAISRWRRSRNAVTAWTRREDPDVVPGPGPDAVALAAALRELPARQRAAIVLHHVADLRVEDVAAQLGVPAGTVKSDLSRGRAAMARSLGEEALA